MSFLNDLLGTKPKVPDLPKLDLGTEAGKAISANKANLPGAEGLVGAANLFSRDQITQMLQAAIPGYGSMTQTISGNIESELKGQLPKDVQDQIKNATASSSLASGTSGSAFSRNLEARDLGLTSLNLTQTGLTSAENWMKTAASLYEPAMMNVSSMFVSPQQQAGFDVEERNSQFQREWMQNQITAMPAMWAQDLKEAVETALSMYSGGSVQHAGTLPIQGGVGSGGGYGGGAAGEGGGAFGPGGGSYRTNFNDSSSSAGRNDFGDELSGGGALVSYEGDIGEGGFMGGY